jgi:hypothetical protein
MTDETELSIRSKAIAHARWQAIEGFNYCPGLSPAARRLGIALVCQMNVQTFACFPGEVRLASLLGLSKRAITDAKNELRAAGLVDWSNPGGPRHRSRYVFHWERLLDARHRAVTLAREATASAKATQIREVQFPNEGSEPVTDVTVDVTRDKRDGHGDVTVDVTRDAEIREVLRAIREVQFHSLGKPTSPVLSHISHPAFSHTAVGAPLRDARAMKKG